MPIPLRGKTTWGCFVGDNNALLSRLRDLAYAGHGREAICLAAKCGGTVAWEYAMAQEHGLRLTAARGNGDGDGDGDGNGNGDGYGDGYGNGNGYGDGYGNGNGDGNGNGNGYGYGYGDGYGYGYGDGYGNGYGYGYGTGGDP